MFCRKYTWMLVIACLLLYAGCSRKGGEGQSNAPKVSVKSPASPAPEIPDELVPDTPPARVEPEKAPPEEPGSQAPQAPAGSADAGPGPGGQGEQQEEVDSPYLNPPKGQKSVKGSILLAGFETGDIKKANPERRLTVSTSNKSFAGTRSLSLHHKGNRLPEPAERVGYISIKVEETQLTGFSHFNMLVKGDKSGGNVLVGVNDKEGKCFRPTSAVKTKDEWNLIKIPFTDFKLAEAEVQAPLKNEIIWAVDFTVDVFGGSNDEYNLLIDEIYLSK